MEDKRKYEFEMNIDKKSLRRIIDFFQAQYDILMTQENDSMESITGGASPHYKINITIKEDWI